MEVLVSAIRRQGGVGEKRLPFMSLKRAFRASNIRVRLLVGLLLAVLFCIQCTRSDAFRVHPLVKQVSGLPAAGVRPQQLRKLERLARTDHLALIDWALEHYRESYRDYTCTLVKQERIAGQLKTEQWIKVKFREQPFSVAMAWVKNAPIGDRVLYVEGKYNGQMLVRPAGLLYKLIGTQMRKPDGPEAMANTLRPVTMFGFRRALESLRRVYALAASRGEGVCRFLGYREVAGRYALALERVLPPREDYPAKTTIWYLDAEWLVPLAVEGWDWDDRLTCSYLYRDVKFNVGLTDEDFTPEANGMRLKR